VTVRIRPLDDQRVGVVLPFLCDAGAFDPGALVLGVVGDLGRSSGAVDDHWVRAATARANAVKRDASV